MAQQRLEEFTPGASGPEGDGDEGGDDRGEGFEVQLASAPHEIARHELEEEARISSEEAGTVSGDRNIQTCVDKAPSGLMGQSEEDIAAGDTADRGNPGVERLPRYPADDDVDEEKPEPSATGSQIGQGRGEQGTQAIS